MALRNVSGSGAGKATRDPIKLTDLAVGGKVTGYVTAIVEGKFGPSLFMQHDDGSTGYVNIAGNVKYLIQDGKIQVGLYTEIRRQEDVKGKSDKGAYTSSKFLVLQDDERTLDTASFDSIPSASTTLENGAARVASEKASVRAKAASLTASMGAKR